MRSADSASYSALVRRMIVWQQKMNFTFGQISGVVLAGVGGRHGECGDGVIRGETCIAPFPFIHWTPLNYHLWCRVQHIHEAKLGRRKNLKEDAHLTVTSQLNDPLTNCPLKPPALMGVAKFKSLVYDSGGISWQTDFWEDCPMESDSTDLNLKMKRCNLNSAEYLLFSCV